MAYPLMPLKIYSGWIISLNNFYDITPDDSSIKNGYFSEDLLLIQRHLPPQRDDIYIVGLSWLPSNNPDGRYRITAALRDFDTILKEFESRDRYEIQKKLDRWIGIL